MFSQRFLYLFSLALMVPAAATPTVLLVDESVELAKVKSEFFSNFEDQYSTVLSLDIQVEGREAYQTRGTLISLENSTDGTLYYLERSAEDVAAYPENRFYQAPNVSGNSRGDLAVVSLIDDTRARLGIVPALVEEPGFTVEATLPYSPLFNTSMNAEEEGQSFVSPLDVTVKHPDSIELLKFNPDGTKLFERNYEIPFFPEMETSAVNLSFSLLYLTEEELRWNLNGQRRISRQTGGLTVTNNLHATVSLTLDQNGEVTTGRRAFYQAESISRFPRFYDLSDGGVLISESRTSFEFINIETPLPTAVSIPNTYFYCLNADGSLRWAKGFPRAVLKFKELLLGEFLPDQPVLYGRLAGPTNNPNSAKGLMLSLDLATGLPVKSLRFSSLRQLNEISRGSANKIRIWARGNTLANEPFHHEHLYLCTIQPGLEGVINAVRSKVRIANARLTSSTADGEINILETYSKRKAWVRHQLPADLTLRQEDSTLFETTTVTAEEFSFVPESISAPLLFGVDEIEVPSSPVTQSSITLTPVTLPIRKIALTQNTLSDFFRLDEFDPSAISLQQNIDFVNWRVRFPTDKDFDYRLQVSANLSGPYRSVFERAGDDREQKFDFYHSSGISEFKEHSPDDLFIVLRPSPPKEFFRVTRFLRELP